jgi:hypothetical protein
MWYPILQDIRWGQHHPPGSGRHNNYHNLEAVINYVYLQLKPI